MLVILSIDSHHCDNVILLNAGLDTQVKEIFIDEENQLLLLETGYRKPLHAMTKDSHKGLPHIGENKTGN